VARAGSLGFRTIFGYKVAEIGTPPPRPKRGAYLRLLREVPQILAQQPSYLEVRVEEMGGRLRDTHDFIRGLPIKLEVKFGLRPAVAPIRVAF
jgi:hypothetical protein